MKDARVLEARVVKAWATRGGGEDRERRLDKIGAGSGRRRRWGVKDM
jgi:hypothetical protein